jgi:hypothetical protein
VVTLAVVGAMAAAIIASPVGAAFNPTKKKIKSIAAAQANKVFDAEIGPATSGLQSRVHWAFIQADGSIPFQSGGIEVTEDLTGEMFVRFPVPTDNKSLLAQGHWGTPEVSQVTVAPCDGAVLHADCDPPNNSPNIVFVRTYNALGGSADGAFYISVLS